MGGKEGVMDSEQEQRQQREEEVSPSLPLQRCEIAAIKLDAVDPLEITVQRGILPRIKKIICSRLLLSQKMRMIQSPWPF